MKKVLIVITVIVALFLGVTFAFKNPQIVELNYYFGIHWTGPLAALLLIVLIAGVILGVFCSYIISLKKKLFTRAKSPQKLSQQ